MKQKLRTVGPGRGPGGFTMVELLVVIAIIGVLVGMLFPAINAARRTALRAQNVNNLRNIGLAIRAYEEAKKSYPPLVKWPTRTGGLNPSRDKSFATSWAFEILPYLEGQTIYDKIDRTKKVMDPANALAMRTPVEIFANPMRRDATANCPFADAEDNFGACIDYAANRGVASPDNEGRLTLQSNLDEDIFSEQFKPKLSGPFAMFTAINSAAVRDGTTHTIAVGDRWLGGPQNPNRQRSDQAGFAGSSYYTIMRFANPAAVVDNRPFRVLPGGIDDPSVYVFGGAIGNDACFVFLDAHTRWLPYDIDAVVFQNLCIIADGEVIPANLLD